MPTSNKPARPSLRIRVMFDGERGIGPGKADLLECILAMGSISAAGRSMKMSYKRAWDLVESMNRAFGEPVVVTSRGGERGGGAKLTTSGERVLAAYRHLQASCEAAARRDLAMLRRQLL